MPPSDAPSRRERLFRFILRNRWWVVAFHALALGPAVFFALKVTQDNSLDRLIVQDDPDTIAQRKFTKIFGGGAYVVMLAEADDPYSPAILKRVDEVEQTLAKLPHVAPHGPLALYRRARAGFDPSRAADFHAFVSGSQLFRKQALAGEHFLAIPMSLAGTSKEDVRAALAEVETVVGPLQAEPAPLSHVGLIGQPVIDRALDALTSSAGTRCFILFMVFMVALVVFLYRSLRTLLAFLIALATTVALSIGFIGATGGVFTIVSALVPLTILITCTATMVYVHSRYVERPEGRAPEDHLVFTLGNKLLACTASLFAAAAGFAALAVSNIYPVRMLGLWVALGMVFTWLTVFTLFPALERIFATPSGGRASALPWFERVMDRLPAFSFRFRWLLVPSALALCGAGAVALFGLPGAFGPMSLQTAGVDYLPHNQTLYHDTKRFERSIGGLSQTSIWLRGKKGGAVTDPEVLRGWGRFQAALERDPEVRSVVGPATLAQSIRYFGGQGDQLPDDTAGLEKAAADLENALSLEPALAYYIDPSMTETHVDLLTGILDWEHFQKLDQRVRAAWKDACAKSPELGSFDLQMVGSALVQAKISHHLVPTLVESFAITVGIILTAFLILFRNGPARLMAMIPSLFAILVMFLVMRSSGVALNIATILVATTVLGSSENDQIHFFYHFIERAGTTEQRMRHALRIAGRAIFYATVINVGGFLAFAISPMPPIRDFGALSALAFALSMLADFTALPAALWLIARDRPPGTPAPAEHADDPADEDEGEPHAAAARSKLEQLESR